MKAKSISSTVSVVLGLLTCDLAAGQVAAPARATAEIGPTHSQMAVATGTVASSKPFKAAQVYLRNIDMRLRYMVYTSGGKFRAVSLFPGTYEISATAEGLTSDVQKLVIKAGEHPALSVLLRELPIDATVSANINTVGLGLPIDVTLKSYEEIYPPGVGRDIIERTCMVCHHENFLPAQPADEVGWQARIDHMMGKDMWDEPVSTYAEGVLSYRAQWLRFSLQDRKDLVDYLVTNFGIDSEPRMVRTDKPTPLDEAKLAKAMFIEYYVPEDPPGKGVNDPQYKGAPLPYRSHRTLQDVRFDAQGNVWATDRGAPVRLVKLDPRTGTWNEWLTPHPTSDLHEIIIGRDGMIWLPEHAERQGTRNYLLGFNPKTENWDYTIDLDPNNIIRNEIKWADSIAIDSKNNIYVDWLMGGALTKIDGKTKQVVGVYPLASTAAVPYGAVIDSKDNIFIALWARGSIAKFDTLHNEWSEFAPPTFPGEVRRLNVDYQDNVWFGIYSSGSKRAGKLAKLDQKTGVITEYEIPQQVAQPYDVSPDTQGNIWFPDSPEVDRSADIGMFDPRTKSFTYYPKPQSHADSSKIQVTKDGAIWFAPRGSRKFPGIGVLYPDMDKIKTLGAYYLNGPPGYPFK